MQEYAYSYIPLSIEQTCLLEKIGQQAKDWTVSYVSVASSSTIEVVP